MMRPAPGTDVTAFCVRRESMQTAIAAPAKRNITTRVVVRVFAAREIDGGWVIEGHRKGITRAHYYFMPATDDSTVDADAFDIDNDRFGAQD